jgi:hypothetical protein
MSLILNKNRAYLSINARFTTQPGLGGRVEIVEAILDRRQRAGLQLDDLLEGFPLGWDAHKKLVNHAQRAAEWSVANSGGSPERSL